jgi:hypothetical protein
MIEEDSIARKHAIGFAIIERHPVRVNLCGGIRTPRKERSCFTLWRRCTPEHLAARRVIKPGLNARFPDRFEKPYCADARNGASVFGQVETDSHMALRTEMVDLIGLDTPDDSAQRTAIVQIAVDQVQPGMRLMRILEDMQDAAGVERTGPPDYPVYLITLR